MSQERKEIVKSCLTSNYLPAMLREHKSGWNIEYYVENPISHELVRKRVRLTKLVSRYKYLKDARLHANKIVMALNIKLATGWNPLFTSEDARLYTPVNEVCEKFIKEKEKEARKDTIRSYASFVGIFSRWLQKNVLQMFYRKIW